MNQLVSWLLGIVFGAVLFCISFVIWFDGRTLGQPTQEHCEYNLPRAQKCVQRWLPDNGAKP